MARLIDFIQGSLDLRTGGQVMSFEGFGVDIGADVEGALFEGSRTGG